jgi:hypothetical protein
VGATDHEVFRTAKKIGMSVSSLTPSLQRVHSQSDAYIQYRISDLVRNEITKYCKAYNVHLTTSYCSSCYDILVHANMRVH